MFLTLAQRKFTTWLAVLTLLFGVLLPVASHAALSKGQSEQWVEICSSAGMLWVRPDTGETSKQNPMGQLQASSHCLICIQQSDTPALLILEVSDIDLMLPQAIWQPTSLKAPVLRDFEVYALVRAPPLFH